MGLKAALLAALIGALLLFAACGGGDEHQATAPTATAAEPGTTSEDANVLVGGRVMLRAERGGQSPLGEMTVTMIPEDGGREFSAVSKFSGHFSVEVPPGTYEVDVEGFAPQQKFKRIKVTVPEGEASFQLPPLKVTD